MDALTGRQRIGAAFKKTFADEKPQIDRIPSYLITGQCNTQLIGVTIREWLLDPKIFAKAQVAAYERYKPDIVAMMWDLLSDAEAIGNELKFPKNGLCNCIGRETSARITGINDDVLVFSHDLG